ncbi:MAG TPA: pyridoxal phosphate-dependent aminotransferase [Prolixibacteraceae bacterium]|mgnify:CR=1 FL=1|nr:pyridoxal phosphate-dependent aminotransferase [Prolixibacteraceae bacterium]
MISEKAQNISPFIVMEVLERASVLEKEGKNIIHLEVGEPDFDVPACVLHESEMAMKQGRTHYTHSLGDPELRQEICNNYLKNYGVKISPDQVIVTSGTSPAILMILLALCNADDEVILSDPGYACYPNFISLSGAKMVKVPVFEEDGFQYRPENICAAITDRTKAILINSPMNPTGNLLSSETLQEIARFAPHIISDEIYHGLVYESNAHSILEYTQNAFVLNGFSKLYAMTGLRLGYVIAPEEFIRPMQKLQQNLFICASSVAQRAGIAALRDADSEVENMKNTYNERRKYMIRRLRELGFKITVEPTGAFYIFVNAKHLSGDSYKLAFDILEKAHVGVTPGIDFGENGEGYLRFSYANSLENIIEGLNRLEKYIADFKGL